MGVGRAHEAGPFAGTPVVDRGMSRLHMPTSTIASIALSQELDGYKQQWFHNYLASHPPSEGNKVGQSGVSWIAAAHCRRCRLLPSWAGCPVRRRLAPTTGQVLHLLCLPPRSRPQFLAELLRQPNSEVHDASTDTVHKIEPANLAHRIIEIRASMSQAMLKFPK